MTAAGMQMTHSLVFTFFFSYASKKVTQLENFELVDRKYYSLPEDPQEQTKQTYVR